MSVANLTRYAIFHNEHCDWNCGLIPQHDGPLVKFEEAMEASSNSLRQLKAEIAARISKVDEFPTYNIPGPVCVFIEEMRQLTVGRAKDGTSCAEER